MGLDSGGSHDEVKVLEERVGHRSLETPWMPRTVVGLAGAADL